MGRTKEQNVWDPRDGVIDAKRATETKTKTNDREEATPMPTDNSRNGDPDV